MTTIQAFDAGRLSEPLEKDRPLVPHVAAVESDDDHADFGDDKFNDVEPYCDLCCNTGELDCHCGGDLCICPNGGSYPCPRCGP